MYLQYFQSPAFIVYSDCAYDQHKLFCMEIQARKPCKPCLTFGGIEIG